MYLVADISYLLDGSMGLETNFWFASRKWVATQYKSTPHVDGFQETRDQSVVCKTNRRFTFMRLWFLRNDRPICALQVSLVCLQSKQEIKKKGL